MPLTDELGEAVERGCPTPTGRYYLPPTHGKHFGSGRFEEMVTTWRRTSRTSMQLSVSETGLS